ncbi:MAG TPA: hypothetical protein PKD80_15715 [Microthrixaceae bacterium]|nr:hypothetical protein [Microthrixaceae bacterium]HMT24279.1 hypothetical protein [Microthrixaceae bacterium]HMT62473.1 hypothetical protein [Microthrixaceae bacterium]
MTDPEPQPTDESQSEPAQYVPERIPDDVYAEHKRSEDPSWLERR